MDPWPSYLTPTDFPNNQCALLLINLVDPDFRGKGIGSLLCDSRIQMAKQRNYRHLFTTVHPHNTASIKILTKFGFSILEERELFEQRLPRYVMHADLETTS
jgi:ribosomal protein S18 acetylase RimI-like enzyme